MNPAVVLLVAVLGQNQTRSIDRAQTEPAEVIVDGSAVRVTHKATPVEGIQPFALVMTGATSELDVACADAGCHPGFACAGAETFDGYSVFPDQHPVGDQINAGLALQEEGAAQTWYGGRFGASGSGTIDSDLAVQRIPGGGNVSPAARFEDGAGMLLRLNTMAYTRVAVRFDWRMFDVSTDDRIVAGYYIGAIDFVGDSSDGPNDARVHRFTSDGPGWGQWTETLRGYSISWQSALLELPVGHPEVWLALWIDAGPADFGKIDNVVVTAIKDCNSNGVSDYDELTTGASPDCNSNCVPDACDISAGTSFDIDADEQPDECNYVDCNTNGVPDEREVGSGDIDNDGDLTLRDYLHLAACLTGPECDAGCTNPTYADACCQLMDLDRDGDVDAGDFAAFQLRFQQH